LIGASALSGCDAISDFQFRQSGCRPGIVARPEILPVTATAQAEWIRADTIATHCVDVAAFQLSASKDSAEVVAQAAVASCRTDILSSINYEAEKNGEPVVFDADNGSQSSIYATRLREVNQYALWRVVEARARRCAFEPKFWDLTARTQMVEERVDP